MIIVRLADQQAGTQTGCSVQRLKVRHLAHHALQAIFMNLARRAASPEYLKQWEAYLRMAMKAQNQCRMTLETLATIKNPPVVFARQANINNGGQQQVNNGPVPPTETRGHEKPKVSAKLGCLSIPTDGAATPAAASRRANVRSTSR